MNRSKDNKTATESTRNSIHPHKRNIFIRSAVRVWVHAIIYVYALYGHACHTLYNVHVIENVLFDSTIALKFECVKSWICSTGTVT